MSAFDLQHIFTPELHLGVSHTSDCPRWTSQSTPTPPTSQTPHFSAAQGHPMTSHCTNFHRFFPLSLVHFSGSQRGSFKKKNFVSKTTEKVPFFAAMLLLLGNNQLSSWVDFKHYFFKKRTSSQLSHMGCSNPIILCSNSNLSAAEMTPSVPSCPLLMSPVEQGTSPLAASSMRRGKKILRNDPSD